MATATKKSTDTYSPRLKDLYEGELRARLKEELAVSSMMQVPRVSKSRSDHGRRRGDTGIRALRR